MKLFVKKSFFTLYQFKREDGAPGLKVALSVDQLSVSESITSAKGDRGARVLLSNFDP